MIRLPIVCAAVLSAYVIAPAAAADWSRSDQVFIEGPAPDLGPAPFYLVNQGPELSGPGIMITEIGLTAERREPYPFIGMSDDLTRLVVTSDYYGTEPLPPAARIMPARAHPRYAERPRMQRKPRRIVRKVKRYRR